MQIFMASRDNLPHVHLISGTGEDTANVISLANVVCSFSTVTLIWIDDILHLKTKNGTTVF